MLPPLGSPETDGNGIALYWAAEAVKKGDMQVLAAAAKPRLFVK
jgi:hypothetical protein